MATAYYSHPDCAGHDMGRGHPECPERLGAIGDHLRATGLDVALDMRDAPMVDTADLFLAHDNGYVAEIALRMRESESTGVPDAVDPDTAVCPGTWRAAQRAAGAAVA